MITLQDKQNFIHSCNTDNGDAFLNAAALYLSKVDNKLELNEFVTILGGLFASKDIQSSESLEQLCLSLRDTVYRILIAAGDVLENNYINLYNYFCLCTLSLDERWLSYELFVDKNLYSEGVGDSERVFLLVLRFFAAFANSKPDAFDKFFEAVTRLNLISAGSVGFSNVFTNFLDLSTISIDKIISLMSLLLQKDNYFARTKEERRSLFNWSLHSLWLVKRYFNHPSWVSLYPEWKEIFYEHIARDECDEAMYVQFFMYHKMGNSFQTLNEWKMFNNEIDRPASEYYKAWCERANLPKCKASVNSGKKIIGFLWDRVVENSPFKVAYSLWKVLYSNSEFRQNYEIKIYVMSYFEKSTNDQNCIDMIQKLGIEVFDGAEPFYKDGLYHSHLEKALYIRDKIISEGVDILIFSGSGYDINDFIISSRAAPKQIFWSHGNHEFDINNIDKRITHCSGTQNCDYRFEVFAVPMDVERFYNPYRDPQLIEYERAKYPKDAFILGVIGRLVKVDSDEYLETIAKIMHQNPNTIFIAAGSGNMDSIRAKVEKLGISDRFYMPGYVDAHVYGHIIDLWCDTFPLEQGESLYEFMYKGKDKTFISLKDEIMLKRCEEDRAVMVGREKLFCSDPIFSDYYQHLQSTYNEPFYITYFAFNIETYIQKALRNINDKKLREGINYYFLKYDRYEKEILLNKLVKDITE